MARARAISNETTAITMLLAALSIITQVSVTTKDYL